MVKMRAIKDFSSTIWGNLGAGDVFEVDPGYVADLVLYGSAEPVDAPKPKDDAESTIAALKAAAPVHHRRGRR